MDEFETSPIQDGRWHSVCREEPEAWGEGDSPEDAYEMARFALDSLYLARHEKTKET